MSSDLLSRGVLSPDMIGGGRSGNRVQMKCISSIILLLANESHSLGLNSRKTDFRCLLFGFVLHAGVMTDAFV